VRISRTLITWILAATAASGPIAAQHTDQQDTESIERAVATHLRALLPGGRIGFDRSAYGRKPKGSPRQYERSPEQIAELTRLLVATPVDLTRILQCADPPVPDSCRLLEVQLAIRIGPPTIVGDLATIWTYVRRKGDDPRQPVEASDSEWALARESGVWRVVGPKQLRSSRPTYPNP